MIAVTSNKNQKVPESIKLIAVGNAGINLLDRMFLETGGAIDCVAINTDSTSLNACMSTEKILLGEKSIRGLGAGGDPELARQAVEESHHRLVELLAEVDAAIFLGGLGGGTAGEVLPELQKLLNKENKPAFHVVTLPFGFEGPRRMRQANETLHLLRQHGGLVAAFPNERLGETASSSGPIGEAFAICDQTLQLAMRSLLEIFHGKGPWETSATELFGLLRDSDSDGATFFSTAMAKGGTRAHDVVPKLLKSPLAKSGLPLADVRSVHIHLSCGASLSLAEIRTTIDLLRRELEEEAMIHVGICTDRREAQELAVTVFGSSRQPLENVLPRYTTVVAKAREEIQHAEARQFPLPQTSLPTETEPEKIVPTAETSATVTEDISSIPSGVSEEKITSSEMPAELEQEHPQEIQTQGEAPAKSSGDLLPGMESVPLVTRPTVRPTKKPAPKPKQEVLPLDVASRGRFERSEPTIEEGEDLDVPTFIRLKIRLK